MQPRWCCLLVCWTRIKFHASYYNCLVTCRQITHAYLQWKLWIKVPGRGTKGKLQRDDGLGSFSELHIDSKTSSIWRKDVGIQDSALTQGIYSIFRSCFKKKFHFHHLPIRILRSFDRVCSWSVNGELYNPSFLLLGSWCSSAALLHQLGSLRWQAALVLPQKYYVKRLNTKLLNSSKKLKAEVCKCCIRTKHMFDINTLSWWHCNYQSKCGWWILLGTLYGW